MSQRARFIRTALCAATLAIAGMLIPRDWGEVSATEVAAIVVAAAWLFGTLVGRALDACVPVKYHTPRGN